MKGLRVGQKVRVHRLNGTFTVVSVYAPHGTADLELRTSSHKTRMHLPIRLMRPAGEDVDQAAQINTSDVRKNESAT
jgi:hypothetical protein